MFLFAKVDLWKGCSLQKSLHWYPLVLLRATGNSAGKMGKPRAKNAFAGNS